MRIYLSPPHMSSEGFELENIKDVFKSNWIAPLGPHVNGFEKEFSSYIGISSAAALSSGTAAIHLALIILGVKPGDKVFCSSLTFSGSANPIVYVGAEPVFIDCDNKTWNMDPQVLEDELKRCAKTGQLPKAVIVVDLYGLSADYDSILSICNRYEIPVIEDAAEALGASYKGRKTGNFGEMAIFSFNGNKIITNSSGGMLVSDNPDYISKARFLSTQARDQAVHYEHSEIGYNYRMSNILAAVGRGQLKVIDRRVSQTRACFEMYKAELGNLPGIEFMPEPEGYLSNRWLTCILVDPDLFGASNQDIQKILLENEIESRPIWKPMHMQPVFKSKQFVGTGVSEKLFRDGVCLPSGSSLDPETISEITSYIISLRR